uniref:PID domain-containing protein n=1 Tax=Globodera rostochiensis TaxID=31243 RepID=A0A914GWD0_GLORO
MFSISFNRNASGSTSPSASGKFCSGNFVPVKLKQKWTKPFEVRAEQVDVTRIVLEVSLSGIIIRDLDAVCQDDVDKHWFAFILKEGESRLCHVFCVLTATIAKEIIVTLGETFNLAYNITFQKQ